MLPIVELYIDAKLPPEIIVAVTKIFLTTTLVVPVPLTLIEAAGDIVTGKPTADSFYRKHTKVAQNKIYIRKCNNKYLIHIQVVTFKITIQKEVLSEISGRAYLHGGRKPRMGIYLLPKVLQC